MAEENTENQQSPGFRIQKIYLKDVSFESPMSPGIFTQQAAPAVDIQMQIRHTVLDQAEGYYEVVLSVTVTAKLEEKAAFLCELHQAGIFQINGVAEKELPLVLEIACPNVLLPFAREAAADFVAKGGFPQLLINPVNFEVLFHEKQKRAAAQSEGDTATQSPAH